MDTNPDGTAAHGLAGYVRAVATAVGIDQMATCYEVSDTTTAYLALSARCPGYPHRDLMLIWGEQDGWVVALETDPGEEPVVLAYHGEDILPRPRSVARFVATLVSGWPSGQSQPPHFRDARDQDDLGDRLARYAIHR